MAKEKFVEKDTTPPVEIVDTEQADKMKRMEEKYAKMEAELEKEKAKNKYKPESTEIPDNQKDLPKGLQSAQTKTVVRDISSIIKEKMGQLKDMATMEVLLDTHVRMRNRLASVKEMGSAHSIKVRGIWKTTAPKMHITKLEGKKISNDEFQVSFGVFEINEKGEKKLYVQYSERVLHDGSKFNQPTSAEYRVAYEVIELIKTGKAITREVIRLDHI